MNSANVGCPSDRSSCWSTAVPGDQASSRPRSENARHTRPRPEFDVTAQHAAFGQLDRLVADGWREAPIGADIFKGGMGPEQATTEMELHQAQDQRSTRSSGVSGRASQSLMSCPQRKKRAGNRPH